MQYLSIWKVAIKVQKFLKNTDMREILLKHGKSRSEIAKAFGVSAVTVRSALKGRTQSDLARRIRKAAMEKGGKEVY